MIDSNSLTNYLIFFAHKKEANALLFQSPLKFKQNSINIYSTQLEDKIISVIICGIGKKRLYACLKNIKLHREDIIIKAGTCALVDSSLKIKHAYYPSFVSDGEKKINLDKIDDFTLIDKGLLTVDGVFTAGSRTIIPVDNVAFIDMEAFYLMDYFGVYRMWLAVHSI